MNLITPVGGIPTSRARRAEGTIGAMNTDTTTTEPAQREPSLREVLAALGIEPTYWQPEHLPPAKPEPKIPGIEVRHLT